MSRFTEQDLKDLLGRGYAPDGNGGYRPATAEEKARAIAPVVKTKTVLTGENKFALKENGTGKVIRKISLVLFGVPMPKQSVRAFVTDKGKVGTYQPTKYGQRVKDYRAQIKKQLPEDFKMFTEQVRITKMHFVYPPLKSFTRLTMDRIERGEIIYKNTKPDISDNLKKLPMDAMSGTVYKDDGMIVTENDIAKYYGTGGCIIIEMEGY